MNITKINNNIIIYKNNFSKPNDVSAQSNIDIRHRKTLNFNKVAKYALFIAIFGSLIHKNKNSINNTNIDNKIYNIPEYIDFKNAQTFDEAIKFGKDNLGIFEYKNFEKNNIDILNWINEGLVNVYNKTKGKAHIPHYIKYESMGKTDNHMTKAAMNAQSATLTINKDFVEELKKYAVNKASLLKIKYPNSQNWRTVEEFEKRANNLKYYFDFATDICYSRFSTIYHEMGHLQHFYNNKKLYVNLNRKITDKETEKLKNLFESKISLIKSISDYAATSPCEFVAETYSRLCDKVKLPNEIIELYKKFGGAMF